MRLRSLRLGSLAVVAAGVVASGAVAQTFSVARDFDFLRHPSGRPLQNVYWVSLPLQPVLADDCNRGAPGSLSPCLGDPGGPSASDGILDSCDLICAWWTARATPATAGSLTVSQWDAPTCAFKDLSASFGFGGRVSLAGEGFVFDPDVGYQVIVGAPAGATYSPRNPVLLQGDPDHDSPGRLIVASTTCGRLGPRMELLNVPQDVLYTRSIEILCGLEHVDWGDQTDCYGNNGPDGIPDTCWDDLNVNYRWDAGERPTGLYDGQHAASVVTWINTTEVNGPVAQSIRTGFGGVLQVVGAPFDLVPGEAYIFQMTPGHSSTWHPPHR